MNPEAAVKYMEGGAVKKPDVSMYMDGGSVEIDGVMDESYVKPRKASKKVEPKRITLEVVVRLFVELDSLE